MLVGTGIAALRGSLPGAEPAPYILRFDEDKPNPLYRRVCYTFAWNAVLSFALLNLAGLVIAAVTGTWYMKQIYHYAYAPLCAMILLLGAAGMLPRVRPPPRAKAPSAATSTARSGRSRSRRRCCWRSGRCCRNTRAASFIKLVVYVGSLLLLGISAYADGCRARGRSYRVSRW